MEQLPSPNLRAYVVWLPVRRAGDVESAARREAGRIHDPRALQFFDPDARLATQFSSLLHLPGAVPAWDVYLVFGPEARWESAPPAPTYWMHQLGSGPSELRLDGQRLAGVVSGLLAGAERRAVAPPDVARPGLAPTAPKSGPSIPHASRPM